MTINAPAAILLAMFLVVVEKQGIELSKIKGTIQNDILKEFIAQNEWIHPPEPSMRLIVDSIQFCTDHLPHYNSISISGYHIREASSTAAQELAFTLRNGIEYVERCLEAGMEIDNFAPRFSFFFNSHNDFFEEIAKFRAARHLWSYIMRERFPAKNPRSWTCRFHTQTAGCSLTAQQPNNNVVRTTLQALAAVLGGTNSLHINSLDEAIALPTEETARLALRTQQILAYENGIRDIADPLGGSYLLETLTKKLEQESHNYFNTIDLLGGMIPAIEKGFPQKEIQEASYQYQKTIEKGDETIVGVNEFLTKDKMYIELLQIGSGVQEHQSKRLQNLRRRRNSRDVNNALSDIKQTAISSKNLIPSLIQAARAYVTVDEIVEVLSETFGIYQEPSF